MKVKFYGPANLLVKTKKQVPFENTIQFKPLFRFDANGEYITGDESLIEKLKSRYDHKEMTEEVKEEAKFHCVKCNMDFPDRGSFLVHTRSKEHKEA